MLLKRRAHFSVGFAQSGCSPVANNEVCECGNRGRQGGVVD